MITFAKFMSHVKKVVGVLVGFMIAIPCAILYANFELDFFWFGQPEYFKFQKAEDAYYRGYDQWYITHKERAIFLKVRYEQIIKVLNLRNAQEASEYLNVYRKMAERDDKRSLYLLYKGILELEKTPEYSFDRLYMLMEDQLEEEMKKKYGNLWPGYKAYFDKQDSLPRPFGPSSGNTKF